MIIAIDGPAAAGKGTLARKLAKAFGFAYLDTGSLYRAVALKVIRVGGDLDDKATAVAASLALDTTTLADPELRLEETGRGAAIVSAIPEVRANLLDFQRNFANSPPEGCKGAVIDGRDIGTVVCPSADVKFFVTASDEERAKRRLLELEGRDEAANFEQVLADMQARDASDKARASSPLKKAEDAHLLDTTNLDIEAVFQKASAIIKDASQR